MEALTISNLRIIERGHKKPLPVCPACGRNMAVRQRYTPDTKLCSICGCVWETEWVLESEIKEHVEKFWP